MSKVLYCASHQRDNLAYAHRWWRVDFFEAQKKKKKTKTKCEPGEGSTSSRRKRIDFLDSRRIPRERDCIGSEVKPL